MAASLLVHEGLLAPRNQTYGRTCRGVTEGDARLSHPVLSMQRMKRCKST